MKEDRIGLTEAARIAGKSPRQIMRDVKAGKLPARGGGRGVPLTFDRADVERLRGGSARAEMLARIVTGYQRNFWQDWRNEKVFDGRGGYRIRQAEGGKCNLADLLRPEDAGTVAFWRAHCQRRGIRVPTDHLRQTARDGAAAYAAIFPRVQDVPADVLSWARSVAQRLQPSGVDFLAALFVLADGPARDGRARQLEDWPKHYPALAKAVMLASGGAQSAADFPEGYEAFLQAVFGGDEDSIGNYALPRYDGRGVRHEAAFPDVAPVLRSVIDEAKRRKGFKPALDAAFDPGKDRQDSDEDGQPRRKTAVLWLLAFRLPFLRAQLSAGRIAALAGLHRVHGYRLAKHVAVKIGAKGVMQLAGLLGCGVPDAQEFFAGQLLRVFRRRQARPLDVPAAGVSPCPGCGEDVPETAQTCPACGRML
jgi:hypothetical protein